MANYDFLTYSDFNQGVQDGNITQYGDKFLNQITGAWITRPERMANDAPDNSAYYAFEKGLEDGTYIPSEYGYTNAYGETVERPERIAGDIVDFNNIQSVDQLKDILQTMGAQGDDDAGMVGVFEANASDYRNQVTGQAVAPGNYISTANEQFFNLDAPGALQSDELKNYMTGLRGKYDLYKPQELFTNREKYDGHIDQQVATAGKFFSIPESEMRGALGHFSPYNESTDYTPYDTRGFDPSKDPGGIFSPDSLSSNIPEYVKLTDARQKAKQKAFNKLALTSVLSMLTLGAGSALGAAAAGAGAGGTAAGAVGAGTAATSSGGLFVGSSGLLGSTGSALGNFALNGAIQGGLSSAISGGNIWKGALTGGIGGGLGHFTSGLNLGASFTSNPLLQNAINSGISGAVSGGLGAAVNGGNIGRGILGGGLGAAGGSLAGGLTRGVLGDFAGANTLSGGIGGAVSGAIRSGINGGDIGRGALGGGLSGGLSGAARDFGFGPQVAGLAGGFAPLLLNSLSPSQQRYQTQRQQRVATRNPATNQPPPMTPQPINLQPIMNQPPVMTPQPINLQPIVNQPPAVNPNVGYYNRQGQSGNRGVLSNMNTAQRDPMSYVQ